MYMRVGKIYIYNSCCNNTPPLDSVDTVHDAELSFCANTFVRESILADVPRAYSECEAVKYRTPVPSLQGY